MDILIPASGSFKATVKYETDDGYVCVSNGGPSILFVYKEFVTLNTEKLQSSWPYPYGDVPELIVTWQNAHRAVVYNVEKVLDKVAGTSYIPNKD